MLIDSPLPFLQISWTVILGATITFTLFFLLAIGFAIRTHRKKPTTGKEGLVGEEGIALNNFKPDGSVEVHGEIWRAFSDTPVKKNEKVVVEEVDRQHLSLKVKPIK